MAEVLSMEATTYSRSRRSIQRWALFRFLIDLTETRDAPLQERTVDWLIDCYLEQREALPRPPRLLTDPTADEPEPNPEQRRLRHVSRAEVAALFGRHAEWVLAQMLAKNQSNIIVNIESWIEFCEQVRAEEALQTTGKLSRPKPINLTRFGISAEWRKKVANWQESYRKRVRSCSFRTLSYIQLIVRR
jgi:hypothetical protein